MGVEDRHRSLLATRLHAFERLAEGASADEGGVERVLSALADLTGGDAALLDSGGAVVASAPGDASWTERPDERGGNLERAQVSAGGEVVATLLLQADELDPAIPRFAATVLAGDLTRRKAALSARRQLAEQVLDDVLRAVLPHDVAVRRLASFGIGLEEPNQVLVGRVGGHPPRGLAAVASSLGSMLQEADRPVLRTVLDHDVVVALAAGATVESVATTLQAELQRGSGTATVAIGGAYSGPAGLRISYAEARAAAGGTGVVTADPLSIADYMRIEEFDAAVVEQGAYVLAPLTAHDARTPSVSEAGSGGLLQTLEVFLLSDCNHAHAAQQLHVHPNTVRYRLRQIELITGHDLSSFLARTHFWLALATARRGAFGSGFDGPGAT